MPPTVEIRGLRKQFGSVEVLQGVELAIERGTIVGYIGPNGAGKSTTVKILVGLLGDYQGEVRVAGIDPAADPVELRRRIGYVPENAVLYESLTLAEYLLFIGRLHGLEDRLVQERADVFLEVLELDSRLGSRIGTLSKGMKQKLLLTSALLHDPEVLFLDEPLSGLDVNASILVKDFLRRLADEGRTIFYCSHVMDVVERVCDRIAILDGGRVAIQGSFEELKAARGNKSLERIFAELTSEGADPERIDRLIQALGSDGRDQA